MRAALSALSAGLVLVAGAPARAGALPGAQPPPPTLTVESAVVDFQGTAGGEIHLEGRFTGLALIAGAQVGLQVGERTEWVTVTRGAQSRGVLSFTSSEHSLTLDVEQGRWIAKATDVLARRENPVRVRLVQGYFTACTSLVFTAVGDHWTFDGRRNRQRPCE